MFRFAKMSQTRVEPNLYAYETMSGLQGFCCTGHTPASEVPLASAAVECAVEDNREWRVSQVRCARSRPPPRGLPADQARRERGNREPRSEDLHVLSVPEGRHDNSPAIYRWDYRCLTRR